MTSSINIHRADWLLTLTGPPIQNGAIATCKGKIIAVGVLKNIKKEFGITNNRKNLFHNHENRVIMPALINAHIHLELSHLAHIGKQPVNSFIEWLEKMVAERDKIGAVSDKAREMAALEMEKQYNDGVIALADIGNTTISTEIKNEKLTLLPFVEYLGLARKSVKPAEKKLASAPLSQLCSAHAPYSTHPEIIKIIKKRAKKLGQIFPIHLAELSEENQIIASGEGDIIDFIKKRGFYDDDFLKTSKNCQSSVNYLHRLKVLDKNTLCVHAIHVSNSDIELIKQSKAKVCLCPGSNEFLNNGKAPVSKYLQAGILPAMGTDSSSSNPTLSMWREMKIMAKLNPEVPSVDIIKMATMGGAEALQLDNLYGSLQEGKSANFISLPLKEKIATDEQLYSYIVNMDSSAKPEWPGAAR